MVEQAVTAILVTYNSSDVIVASLAALLRQPEISQIIVVDNCSVDNTRDVIAQAFPNVTVIANPKNDGFGRANNIGLEKVQTDFALLVNPDAVLEDGALNAMLIAATQYPDTGIVSPMLLDIKGGLHHNFKRNVFIREKYRPDFIQPEGDCCAEYLSGAVWLMNMKYTRKVGFFDSNIFLFYEDDDLCLRMRQADYSLVVAHNARALHLQGESSGKATPQKDFFIQKHMMWSRLYIEYKYHGEAAAKKLLIKIAIVNWLKFFMYSIFFSKRKVMRLRGRLKGVAEFSESLKSGNMQRQP